MKYLCLSCLLWMPYLLSSQSIDSSAIKEIDSLIQVSQKLISKNDFEKALEVNMIAEKLALENFGRESVSYGKACHNKGRILNSKGDYLEAESAYLEAKSVREVVLGKEHPDYLGTLINLATLYNKLTRFDDAEALFIISKSIFENNIKNMEHPFYNICIINLGNLYLKLGQFSKSESLFLQSKAISEKKFGNKHADYGRALLNLAVLYNKMGEFSKSESLYLETKAIYEKLMDKEDPIFLKLLNNIGRLYIDKFQYDKAEFIYSELKVIYDKAIIRDNIEYATYLDNQAILHHSLGQFEKAESFYLKSKSIIEKFIGKNNPNYLSCQNNLAILYQGLSQYSKAEYHYIESKEIREKMFGNKHFEYAASLSNLANFYYEIGNYEKAEMFFLEAKSITEISLGKEHPEYAQILTNLAILYTNIGRYDLVEGLFLEAKAIYEKSLGKKHPSYLNNIYNLAKFYEIQSRFTTAEHLLTEFCHLYQENMTMSISFLSEVELATFNTTFGNISNALGSLLHTKMRVDDIGQGSILGDLAYDQAIFDKGFLLNSITRLNNLLNTSLESIEIQLQLKSCLRLLNKEYSKPIFDRSSVLELEEKSNNLEKKLICKISGYGETIRQVKWHEVQSKLKWNEVSIEFVHYKYFNKKQTDSIMYAALVLLPNDTTPHFVPLFEEKELNQLLSNSQSRRLDYVAEVYRFANDNSDTLSRDQNKSLYEVIWKPLEPYLKGVNKIYFSPSGLLHRINHNAIALNDQTLLSDRYDLVQLSSTRQLATNEGNAKSKIINACIYGGINFEMDSTAVLATHQEIDTNGIVLRSELSFSYTDSTLRGGAWKYLSGSEQEANDINKIMYKAGIKSALFKGKDATEEAFKKLGDYKTESPQIIHISTHGYFFPDPKVSRQPSAVTLQEEPVFKISEHPMLRSGLIMAGANHAWKTGKPITPEAEDGILTAYEISQLNLRNTELVVLSACETGLGDIQGNEGVYGLQRAFKIAGVKNLIMSLWQVPDQQTSELMTSFYRYWLIKKKSIRESLKLAQNDLRKKGLESFYWAGFVLVE